MKTEPCAQKGCKAVVLVGRGYCVWHGGPQRLARETREAEALARKSAKNGNGDNHQKPVLVAESKPRPKRRTEWGPAGAPCGTGLSRWAKYDDRRGETSVF